MTDAPADPRTDRYEAIFVLLRGARDLLDQADRLCDQQMLDEHHDLALWINATMAEADDAVHDAAELAGTEVDS